MPSITFIESTTAATQGFQFYDSTSGDVNAHSTTVKYGPRSIKCVNGAGGAIVVRNNTDAGRLIGRHTFWFRFDALPSATTSFYAIADGSGNGVIRVRLNTTGNLVLANDGAGAKTGTVVLSANTWYRIAMSTNIISTASWTAKVYYATTDSKAGTLDISGSNADFSLTTATNAQMRLGCLTAATTFTDYFNGIYVDDGSDNSDPGDIRVTAKLPAANNTNNFDTAIGNNPANRYENVNERPLSETNGWQQAAATDVQENYGLQGKTAGDINVAGLTIIGRMAWIWAKRGSLTACTHRASAASGTANPTTTFTITIPAGTSTGDSLFVQVTSRDHTSSTALPTVTDNDVGGNTWALIGNSTDRVATLWWKRATSGTASKTITVAGCVGSCSGGVSVYQNASTSNTPYTDIVVEDNASGNETHASFTPTWDGSAICFGVFNYNNDNAVSSESTANLGAMTERWEQLSTGGNDCACVHASINGTDTVRAATGNITWAQTDGVTHSISWAVRPENLGNDTAKIMDNGTETAITLSSTASALFTVVTTSNLYPSNAAGIGIRSTADSRDTFLYECGMLIAYNNAATGWGRLIGQERSRLVRIV